MPMNSMPRYMASPKAAHVAMIADRLPSRPIHGLERTWSAIIDVSTLNTAIRMNVIAMYGTTDCVFFSSSLSSVRDANIATLMCLKRSPFSARPTLSRKASSHFDPLQYYVMDCKKFAKHHKYHFAYRASCFFVPAVAKYTI